MPAIFDPAAAWTPGVPIVVSDALPLPPSHREVARRLVRHGLADVLDWLGERVGPEPDAPTHALYANPDPYIGDRVALFVSRDLSTRIKQSALKGALDAIDDAFDPEENR